MSPRRPKVTPKVTGTSSGPGVTASRAPYQVKVHPEVWRVARARVKPGQRIRVVSETEVRIEPDPDY